MSDPTVAEGDVSFEGSGNGAIEDGYLYRREELLVLQEQLTGVMAALESEGFDVALDPQDPELGIRRVRVSGRGIQYALEFLASRGFASDTVQPNHVLTGLHGNHLPGTVTLPVPAGPLDKPSGHEVPSGVVVGVLDTGLVPESDSQPHDFFAGRCDFDEALDYEEPYPKGSVPYKAGHGTFVAGIILRMAPAARVVSARVLSSEGVTDDWSVGTALITMWRRHRPHLHIFNLSLGGYTRGNVQPLASTRAIREVTREGVIVVASGENVVDHRGADKAGEWDARAHSLWPASLEETVAVAALETKSRLPAPLQRAESVRIAPYNQLLPSTGFAAIGDWISTYGAGPRWTSGAAEFSGWARWVGASFATAAVSGALAQVIADKKLLALDAEQRVQAALEELRASASGFKEVFEVRNGEIVPSHPAEVAAARLGSEATRAEEQVDELKHISASHGAQSVGTRHPIEDYVGGRRQPTVDTVYRSMFSGLPPATASVESLRELAAAMTAKSDAGAHPDGGLPAGYAFFGQFVGHDLTFDPATSGERQAKGDERNARTPRLDLDSLYGLGPAYQPYLYETVPGTSMVSRAGSARFLLGAGGDLPRNGQQRALTPDPRNDDNVVLSQLTAAFLQFHNRLQDMDQTSDFETTQRLVRWHYQWLVVNDYLPKIVTQELVDDVLRYRRSGTGYDGKLVKSVNPRFRLFHPSGEPFVPVEFALAAYRFGHSLLKPDYQLNDESGRVPLFGNGISEHEGMGQGRDLRGFRSLPDWAKIQWHRFFDAHEEDAHDVQSASVLQFSSKIDEMITDPLARLPRDTGSVDSLALRTLLRGSGVVPSGQDVARSVGFEVLKPEALDPKGRMPKELRDNTPLAYYILREAAHEQDGERLGAVGGRIVAEVVLRLLLSDKGSYLANDPGWEPIQQGLRTVGGLMHFVAEGQSSIDGGADRRNRKERPGLGLVSSA